MKLRKFRVLNFRSVQDSDWIETDEVTALIGTNEAGKTNILLPLWKLNPAKEGEIIATADYPRKHFNEYRHEEPKPVFIRAIFDVEGLASELAAITGVPDEQLRNVEARRRFGGPIEIAFPDFAPPSSIDVATISTIVTEAEAEIGSGGQLKSEEDLKGRILETLATANKEIARGGVFDRSRVSSIHQTLSAIPLDAAPKTSTLVPRYRQAIEAVSELVQTLSQPDPADCEKAVSLVLANLPKFVYYSTYGNLDSEIYLPHVIANLKRTDLGQREQAKARTLRVLFEFVRLSAKEILELGQDFKEPGREPQPEELAKIAEKKKQRSILLQSASALLTERFREWWKQGEYRFRFEADGNHFRIWVSDDKRPEEIELEGRSTGLQWFLSFYLVFLVEQQDAHEGAILLLDEPGLSLHPLAQRDLSAFFDGLAKNNQLLYTCHSPFLVDADRLDRARKVYIGADGTSKVSPDLRAAEGDTVQRGASYAVFAAVGLSVAESILLGCAPVIVEGASDQHYLTAIKSLLIASGRLRPGRELVFPPAGGTKGVKAVASLVAARDEELPPVLFDDDAQGRATAEALKKGLYSGSQDRVLSIGAYVGFEHSEIEDLIPPNIVVRELDRWQRGAPAPFADSHTPGQPIVPQIEKWADLNGVQLDLGWKVELAKRVKKQMLAAGRSGFQDEVLGRWEGLFEKFGVGSETTETDVRA